MKDKKRLGVMAQLVMLCAVPMIIMVIVVTFYSIGRMRDLVQDSTMEREVWRCKQRY